MRKLFATPLRALIVAVTLVALGSGIKSFADNYNATAGSGLLFAARAMVGNILFPQFILCDATNGTACAQVVSANTATISGNALAVTDATLLAAIQSPIPTGTNTIGAVTAGISAVSTGGWSSFVRLNGPQSFGVIKAGPGILHAQQSYTISSSPAWLKFYDQTTNPNCGVNTVVKQLLIPANSTAANGGGNNAQVLDMQFNTGIAYCITVNIISTDVVSPTANNFIINVDYK